MASNTLSARVKTPQGSYVWGSLIEPGKNLSNILEWHLGLQVPEDSDEYRDLYSTMMEMVDKAAQQIERWPTDPKRVNLPIKPAKEKDDKGNFVEKPGYVVLNMKRKYEVHMRNGETKQNTPPVLYDSKGKPCHVPSIGYGSDLKASVDMFAYAKAGQFGIGLGLRAVQIIKLELGEADSFDEVEGGWTGEPEEEQGGGFDEEETGVYL
jgi:hypothetical protein